MQCKAHVHFPNRRTAASLCGVGCQVFTLLPTSHTYVCTDQSRLRCRSYLHASWTSCRVCLIPCQHRGLGLYMRRTCRLGSIQIKRCAGPQFLHFTITEGLPIRVFDMRANRLMAVIALWERVLCKSHNVSALGCTSHCMTAMPPSNLRCHVHCDACQQVWCTLTATCCTQTISLTVACVALSSCFAFQELVSSLQ